MELLCSRVSWCIHNSLALSAISDKNVVDTKIYRSNYVKSMANQCLENSCYVYLSEPGHAFIIIQRAQTAFNCLSANEKLDMRCAAALIIVTVF